MTSARPHAYVSRVCSGCDRSVRVIEEGEHIIAEIDGGRLLMQGAGPDVTYGAQERT
jgi:hypothetical protein